MFIYLNTLDEMPGYCIISRKTELLFPNQRQNKRLSDKAYLDFGKIFYLRINITDLYGREERLLITVRNK